MAKEFDRGLLGLSQRCRARQDARRQKEYSRSDSIRDQLLESGVAIKDTKEGTEWEWKPLW